MVEPRTKAANPLKYHLLIGVLRIVGLTFCGVGLLLVGAIAVSMIVQWIAPDPNDEPPSAGVLLGSLFAALLIGGGLYWFGSWLLRAAAFYRPRFEQAVAAIPPAPSPSSAVVQAGCHAIQFSQKANRWRNDSKRIGFTDHLLPLHLALIVGILVSIVLDRILHVPRRIVFGVFLILLFIVGMWSVKNKITNWFRYRQTRRALAPSPDESCRLRCIGLPEELEEYGEFADVPFEPTTFNVSWTSIAFLNPLVRRTAIVMGVLTLLIASYAVYFINIRFGIILQTVIAVSVLSASVLTFLLWQTYLEFSPGRLDIVQAAMFGRGESRTFSINLRTARVLADMRNWHVHIERPVEGLPPVSFSIFLAPHRRGVVHRLFLAAISSYESALGPVGRDETGHAPASKIHPE